MGETGRQTSPQFWAPKYVSWHHSLLRELAIHLRESPHLDRVLYIRNQWNAVYTEGTSCDASYLPDVDCTWKDNVKWQWPPDADEYRVEWTEQIAIDYERELIDVYFDAFGPLGIPVALRRNRLPDAEMDELFASGNPLAWGPMITDNRYDIWDGWAGGHTREFRYMRAWGNLGFMEAGRTAAERAKASKLSEYQESYGTILRSLQVGLPYIGTYGDEVARAIDDAKYRKIFAFANRHAGWSRYPKSAPGGWLVLGRFHPDENSHFKKVSLTSANWGYFLRQANAGDFDPKSLVDSSRFGLTARSIDKASVIDVNDALAESVRDEVVEIQVAYLVSSGQPHLQIDHEGKLVGLSVIRDEDEGDWRIRTFQADGPRFSDGIEGEGDLLLTPTEGAPIVHRIELIRTGEPASGDPPRDVPPVDPGTTVGPGNDGGPTESASGSVPDDDSGCACGAVGSGGSSPLGWVLAGLTFVVWTHERRRRSR